MYLLGLEYTLHSSTELLAFLSFVHKLLRYFEAIRPSVVHLNFVYLFLLLASDSRCKV